MNIAGVVLGLLIAGTALWAAPAFAEGGGFHPYFPPTPKLYRGTDSMIEPSRPAEETVGPKFCHWSRDRQAGSCPLADDAVVGTHCTCPVETTVGQMSLWVLIDGTVRVQN